MLEFLDVVDIGDDLWPELVNVDSGLLVLMGLNAVLDDIDASLVF